ncbi:NAD(P)/FAD-dependent oxidoreductase [Aliikangiella sp. IMCC44359]|uniref:NAD(P)/FAD-dependent oxidoreductase n=1 Tax=Aliikangiella sp. IMCC44359 TaxID=3459125 RepID=UPI00403B1E5C
MQPTTQNHINSYYSATLNSPISFPSLEQNVETETCIIGGGYAGLMTAMSLIERGHKNLIVLEKNLVGWGASGRNGGFVFGGYSLGPSALVKQVGEKSARNLYQLTTAAVDLIRQRVTKYKIDCDLIDSGVIWANWFKDQQRLFKEQAFMQRIMGVNWKYFSPEELSELVISSRYQGGLFEKNAMHFHPLNYAQGIARQISLSGGKVFEQTEVLKIEIQQTQKYVETYAGKVYCKNIVVAGGGYINGLCPPVARSILPIATYVMTTEKLNEKMGELLNTQAAIYDNRFAFDYYRPLKDSRILWGGRISASTKTPKNLSAQMKSDLLKVFPQLNDIKIDYAWDGWMAYARHQMAQIGQLQSGVWYSIGFGGHGVGPTTAAGEIVASAIVEQDERYKLFKPWGLPWNGGAFGPIAAQVSYWWYQLKDQLQEFLES